MPNPGDQNSGSQESKCRIPGIKILDPGDQNPGSRGSKSRIPGIKIPDPGDQNPGSRGSKSRIPGIKIPNPRDQNPQIENPESRKFKSRSRNITNLGDRNSEIKKSRNQGIKILFFRASRFLGFRVRAFKIPISIPTISLISIFNDLAQNENSDPESKRPKIYVPMVVIVGNRR